MTTKKSIWAELRYDFVEDDYENGFISISIDAWKTNDDGEEGAVIAKVFGKWMNNEPHVFVDYRDNSARCDTDAQEVIEKAKKEILNYIKPLPKRIIVTKALDENAWYKDFIGKTFKVLNIDICKEAANYNIMFSGSEKGISIEDCIPVKPTLYDWIDVLNVYISADILPKEMTEFIKEFKTIHSEELTVEKFVEFLQKEKERVVEIKDRPKDSISFNN